MKLKRELDFFGHRKIFYGISIALIVIAAIFAVIFGIRVDIQFTGGTIANYSYTGSIDTNAIVKPQKRQLA